MHRFKLKTRKTEVYEDFIEINKMYWNKIWWESDSFEKEILLIDAIDVKKKD
jgi:hypothetical protein